MKHVSDWIHGYKMLLSLLSVPIGIGVFIGLATFWALTLLNW